MRIYLQRLKIKIFYEDALSKTCYWRGGNSIRSYKNKTLCQKISFILNSLNYCNGKMLFEWNRTKNSKSLLEKSGKFAKIMFHFLEVNNLSSWKIVVTGKPLSLVDGDGMQVSCKLVFIRVQKSICYIKKIH